MKAYQSCSRHEANSYAHFFAPVLRWFAVAAICLGLIAPAQAAKKAADKRPPPAAGASRLPGDDLAKAMLERGRPSDKDNFIILMPLAGTWDYTETIWTDSRTPPENGMGVIVSDLVLDRRFLSSKSSGNIAIGGQQIPFEAEELIGFDNGRKVFNSTSADTLTTGMTIGSGAFNQKTHQLDQAGHFTNPLTGAEQRFRSEIKLVDPDHYTRTLFAADKSGKETKLIEFDYTKRQ